MSEFTNYVDHIINVNNLFEARVIHESHEWYLGTHLTFDRACKSIDDFYELHSVRSPCRFCGKIKNS